MNHEHSYELSGIFLQGADGTNMRSSPSPPGEGHEAHGSLQCLVDYMSRSVASREFREETNSKCRKTGGKWFVL